ncbi:unnamed protein product [Cylindrotheca closterium]|uniref:Lon N-terminal domain-containing protein n=1 Tax=Cylindrotheca closterium TaxID=2856 RepID=A0AAD2FQR8_9STRA|nr:unnamed protein product [Cylindrotheca closterium]
MLLIASIVCMLSQQNSCHAWLGAGSLNNHHPSMMTSRYHSFSSSSSFTTRVYYTKDDKDNNSNENNSNKEGDEEAEARRMEAVRSLQVAFYKPDADVTDEAENISNGNDSDETSSSSSSSTSSSPTAAAASLSMTRLEASSGKLHNLPLWRAPWWEVPGRSNVLNVHDPIYTNMFEQIIRKPKPWCFGHLFLEGGSKNLRAGSLATWETHGDSKCTQHSATMGCLMHIQDYRRFSNGRLLLLVHAMERFAVTDIQQELPYSIVDAQIVPDPEELDAAFLSSSCLEKDDESSSLPENQQLFWKLSEADLALSRGMAVQESVRYHDYEYDPDQSLAGISNKTYLEPTDILWSSIARLLPFCPFAKTLAPPLESEVKATLQHHFGKPITPAASSSTSSDATCLATTCTDTESSSSRDDQQSPPPPSLESQLFQKGILKAPLFDPEYASKYDAMDSDELEYELWLAMNRYLSATKIPISPIVLGLLPRRDLQMNNNNDDDISSTTSIATNVEDWPSDFLIYNIVRDFEATQLVPTNTTTTSTTTSTTSTLTAKTLRHQKARHDFVRVHPHYPKHRRQKRLSYSALSLLEKNADVTKQLRPQFLQTPSTKQRLRLVLEKLDQWQEEFWGEFQ